jgi:hypothetical protein
MRLPRRVFELVLAMPQAASTSEAAIAETQIFSARRDRRAFA